MPWYDYIPGAIAGLAGAGASMYGSQQAVEAVEKQNQGNMDLAKYKYQKDLEMWNMTNEYNSPQAQMQRLKDAGLNPNMVYGNGSAANQAAKAPSFEAPRLEAYQGQSRDYQSAVDSFVNSMMTAAQIKSMSIQNKIAEYDADYKMLLADNQRTENDRNRLRLQAEQEDYPSLRWRTKYETREKDLSASIKETEKDILYQRQQMNEIDLRMAEVREKMQQDEWLKLKAQVDTEIANANIRQHEGRDYEELGIRPSDPLWSRILGNALINVFGEGKAKTFINMLLGL